jgi:hypothetical protein
MIDTPKFEKQNILQIAANLSEVFVAATFPSGDFYQVTLSGKIKNATTRERDGGSLGQGYSFDELNDVSFQSKLERYSESDDTRIPEFFLGDYRLDLNTNERKSLYIQLRCKQEECKTVIAILSLSNKSKNLELRVNLKPNDDQKIKLTHDGLVYAWSLWNRNNYIDND